jgi:hypothetical protein
VAPRFYVSKQAVLDVLKKVVFTTGAVFRTKEVFRSQAVFTKKGGFFGSKPFLRFEARLAGGNPEVFQKELPRNPEVLKKRAPPQPGST